MLWDNWSRAEVNVLYQANLVWNLEAKDTELGAVKIELKVIV